MLTRCSLRHFHSSLPNPNPNPSSINYPLLLRSCKTITSLLRLHARLTILGISSSLTHHLITSYASLNHHHPALTLFTSSPHPTTHLFNTIIRHSHPRTALHLYRSMLTHNLQPDKYTFTFAIKACANAADATTGESLREQITHRGLQADVYIATALVDMYVKLGRLQSATEVFEQMPQRDSISWNAIISGFTHDPVEAIRLFKRMLKESIPNFVTLLNLFPAICELADVRLCEAVHGVAIRRCFLYSVENGLIDTYFKCGSVGSARRLFDGMMRSRDEVTWGTMISGYVYNARYEEALDVFDEFRLEDLRAKNNVAVVSALVAAAEMRDLERGVDIHRYVTEMGVNMCVQVCTVLVTMYVKCGEMSKAELVFGGMERKDVIAWSAMIAALVQTDRHQEAISFFRRMQSEGAMPNGVTIASVLPACADSSAPDFGMSLHCLALKSNFVSHVSVGTALVAMYAQCGLFSSANAVFESLQPKDVVAWNALINGYAQAGDAGNAIQMFRRLLSLGQYPDPGTMVGVLVACASLNVSGKCVCAHGFVIKNAFESDLHVKNAMLDMYAKCGDLRSAESLFLESRSFDDIISWNTMISGYMHNGRATEAISAFYKMRSENLKPNAVTLVSVIPAAAYIASLKEGLILHSYVIRTGFESHLPVGNSLMDMYSKCGQLKYARDFFNQMCHRDTVSWNAMILGYAVNGLSESAIALFSQMKHNSISVDSVSFLGVLSACRHGGLIDEGRAIFNSMRSEYHLEPNLEHYACMVDLLGRAGQFDEAWSLIQRMPMEPDASLWGALLGACKMHSNVKMAEIAVDHLIRLEPRVPSHYVVLSSIYAQAGNWADSRKLKETSSLTELNKIAGCSWIDTQNNVQTLEADDESYS